MSIENFDHGEHIVSAHIQIGANAAASSARAIGLRRIDIDPVGQAECYLLTSQQIAQDEFFALATVDGVTDVTAQVDWVADDRFDVQLRDTAGAPVAGSVWVAVYRFEAGAPPLQDAPA